MKISPVTYGIVGVAVIATVIALMVAPAKNEFRTTLETRAPGYQSAMVFLGELPAGLEIPIRVRLDGLQEAFRNQPSMWHGSCPCTSETALTTTGGLFRNYPRLNFILNTVATPGRKETTLTGTTKDGHQIELLVRYILTGGVAYVSHTPWELREDDGHPWYMKVTLKGEEFAEDEVILDVAAARASSIRIHSLDRDGDKGIITIRSNTATIDTTGAISLGFTVKGTQLDPLFVDLPVVKSRMETSNTDPAPRITIDLTKLHKLPQAGSVAIAELNGVPSDNPGFIATLTSHTLILTEDTATTAPRTPKLLRLPTGVVLLYPNQPRVP